MYRAVRSGCTRRTSSERSLLGIRIKGGGEGGIRTHGTVPRTLAFEASTFNHSVTSPQWSRLLV